FMGHSQGGITGAMFFGVEPLIAGGVFSGSGGGLSITLMERKDLFDIEAMIREAFWIDDQDELTTFHPVIMLIQMIADATDPLNYAPFYFTSDGDTGPRDVLITEGLFDDQTPPSTTDALAAAARIPLLWPPAKIPVSHNILGLSPVYPPVSDNITADGKKATAALIHFPENDHFAIYQNHDAVAYYQSFLASLGYSGTAIIK
ncbi:MAG: hypothetical protein FJ088_14795, partial [Deltaproteobacteria bacterium]|nr:hypothetical protein [Deltaproteobacteria bacterium]